MTVTQAPESKTMTNSQPPQTTKSSKVFSVRFIASMLFLFLLGMFNSRYVLWIIPYTEQNKPYADYTVKRLSNFWVTAVCAMVLIVLRRTYETLTLKWWQSMAKCQDVPAKRERYGKKATDNSFQAMWFVFIVFYGYQAIKGSPIHHWWIGGAETDWKGLYEDLPFHDDPGIFLYCLINHSYHLQTLIYDLFLNERMNDFEINAIHHLAANILLFNSNYGSMHRYGAVILFLNDASDFFVSSVRMLDSLQAYKNAALAVYFSMLVTWLWFRLLYFPWIIYSLAFHSSYPPHLSDMNSYLKTHTFFLVCLLLLNILWFKMMLNLGYTWLVTGKVSDKINDVEAKAETEGCRAVPPSEDKTQVKIEE